MHDIHYCLLDHLGAIAIRGPEAAGFLQGQATCDVRLATPAHSTPGALCTPKGRVIATFRLVDTGDGYLLLLDRSLLEAVLKRLRMYVLRAKVELADAGADWRIEGWSGTGLEPALAQLGLALPDSVDGASTAAASLAVRVAGEPARCLLLRRAESPALQEMADAAPWRLADIANGLPQIGAQTSEAFIPQMLNLDLTGAVSFQKGCYTGQEIVARTHYLGQAKRRTYRYATPATAVPGDALYAENQTEAAGTVVNAGGGELLAVVACEHSAGPLRLHSPDGPVLQRLPLPYDTDAQE